MQTEREPVLSPAPMVSRTSTTNNVCEVCGNQYDKCFEVHQNGEIHVFDSFECAIHVMAPICAHCGCKIVGHGMEANGAFYCCAHCAEQSGVHEMTDRTEREKLATHS